MGTSAPLPGQAPLVAADAAALLRRNGTDPSIRDRPLIRFGERVWTHGEFLTESMRWAELLERFRPEGRATHLGVLCDNLPDYLFAFGGAALAGSAVVGLNHTRLGEHLARDVRHADVDVVLTEPRHADQLAGALAHLDLDEERVLVTDRYEPRARGARIGVRLDDALAGDAPAVPERTADPDLLWALIFTSGTTSAPKAVICSQRRLLVTGNRMSQILRIAPSDVGYVSMPLFHSNSVMVGLLPALVVGASVGLARRFTASGWLDDVRHYGATWFNYTGKPLSYLVATPAQPRDADNPVRVAFGNEGSPAVVEEFSRRFGVFVIDAFGATEGGVALDRSGVMPPGALGWVGERVKVVDPAGNERPLARFDAGGRLLNADECVGEIVNTAGGGPFEGYYNNATATAEATRNGWYWSGDLGYVDENGALYFAGRTGDWLRVDGENFPAGPIEDALAKHPDVVAAAVYGVPDAAAGDQVMAALRLRDGASLDPVELSRWLDSRPELGPKWRPRYLRVVAELPSTGTNKVQKRALVRDRFQLDRVGSDPLYVRGRGEPAYRRFTAADEAELRAEFSAAGRERFWDL